MRCQDGGLKVELFEIRFENLILASEINNYDNYDFMQWARCTKKTLE
ncbi:hypothetical protein NF865_08165 [Thermococcus aggregans]|uniref:Uncharacterized protein n=1 Tax=Thermococcus aggregans TaxID=110163 RepID=A0A9E7MWU2_THEAG|nr:hypothetical protein [Thermococcus aggregans]USS40292.1 hypothetical protein NF865_08165 [Thermococcus aggregans]